MILTTKEQFEQAVLTRQEIKTKTKTVFYTGELESYNNELLIGTFTEHGIYAGIAKGKKVYVKLKDEPKQLTWEEAMEYPKDGYHLPTKEELMIIYANKDIINKALVDNGGEPFKEDYWSSTEYSSYSSWLLYMGNGNITTDHKNSNYYVRPVVAF